jgi:uncharacterized protein YjbI with pentapeptide repeats
MRTSSTKFCAGITQVQYGRHVANQRGGLNSRQIVAGLTTVAAIGIIIALAWWLIVPAADWLAHHDVGSAQGAALINARNNDRGSLLTLGAGIVAAGALVFTARNFLLSRRTLELTEQGQRRSFELTEQAQVTDRYTKAIEQLGSDKLDIRIGGIYALERIAHDSARDHPTIMEVLTTFIREHSREQQATGADSEKADQAKQADRQQPRAETQAALTVLARRDKEHDTRAINLAGANLAGADLTRASLAGADLAGADLTRASLRDADLACANLSGAEFTRAVLINADLGGANLLEATLTSANLGGANLVGAALANANLTSANLAAANLTRAIIIHASLTRAGLLDANLTDANLTGADLTAASLTRADLTRTNLLGANLTGANLIRATWNSRYMVEGWELDRDGRLQPTGN